MRCTARRSSTMRARRSATLCLSLLGLRLSLPRCNLLRLQHLHVMLDLRVGRTILTLGREHGSRDRVPILVRCVGLLLLTCSSGSSDGSEDLLLARSHVGQRLAIWSSSNGCRRRSHRSSLGSLLTLRLLGLRLLRLLSGIEQGLLLLPGYLCSGFLHLGKPLLSLANLPQIALELRFDQFERRTDSGHEVARMALVNGDDALGLVFDWAVSDIATVQRTTAFWLGRVPLPRQLSHRIIDRLMPHGFLRPLVFVASNSLGLASRHPRGRWRSIGHRGVRTVCLGLGRKSRYGDTAWRGSTPVRSGGRRRALSRSRS